MVIKCSLITALMFLQLQPTGLLADLFKLKESEVSPYNIWLLMWSVPIGADGLHY